ncbi:origin recognition complex subunit 5 [Plasmodium gaboni]|uniref:Origin recognition complex subunit 5 n=1 Tax=Plasmodium gaboni TaxID=647221 RepID=A0ABY1UGY8_9APIC|nr:origin recognition complex subunit 5 [Plasmodium gaboni]
MYKIKNNESDINSDDCNETAQECIYGFSSPKKSRKESSIFVQNNYDTCSSNNIYEKKTCSNTSASSEKKYNKKEQSLCSDINNSNKVNIEGLKINEKNYDRINNSEEETNVNDDNDNNYVDDHNDANYDDDDDDEDVDDFEDIKENDKYNDPTYSDIYKEAKKCNIRCENIMNSSVNKNNLEEMNECEQTNSSDNSIISSSSEEEESCSEETDNDDNLYDEELNEIIDEGYFKELMPAIPHDILQSYISCLKICGFERQVQLHRLINLLGDLRDPISVIQILGLPGMGKTKVVKNFIKLTKVPYAYVNCLMAVYQSGRSAKNVIYHTILKDLSMNLLHEFNEYKRINNITNYSYDPTKLVPNHVSNTDNFFSILHKLLSFKPEDIENNTTTANTRSGSNSKKKETKGQNDITNKNTKVEYNNNNDDNNNNCNSVRFNSNKNYYKDKLYDRSVVFILDNIRYLVRTHPDLFYALTRIHEYIKGPYNDVTKANKTTRGLCIILINRSPLPDEIFDGLPQPPTVWFDSYTSEMCKNILYRLYNSMCFESLLTYNDKDLKIYFVKDNKNEFLIKRNDVILENDVIYDIWCRYVDYIINVSYKDYKSDFHELLFICSHMWPLFIKPILDGVLEPIVENMNALQRNIDTHIRVATYNHSSHFTFELIDSVFLNENNLKNKIDLSFYSKILLVGAYLASRNLPLTDKRFFNATVKGGAFTLPKKRKGKNKNESILTLISKSIPKNFTFIRWLCLTDCLLVCFFDEQLVLNSLICQQINTLIQLGFISFSSPNNLSCLVRNSLMNGVQWSGYCGSALLNTTTNFSSLTNNIFCETNNSMTYESLDPYTKLVIQVPEETIRNISKEMKIPLDELII